MFGSLGLRPRASGLGLRPSLPNAYCSMLCYIQCLLLLSALRMALALALQGKEVVRFVVCVKISKWAEMIGWEIARGGWGGD